MFFTYYILMAKNKEKSDKSFPIHLLFLTDNYQLLSESHYFGRIFFFHFPWCLMSYQDILFFIQQVWSTRNCYLHWSEIECQGLIYIFI